MVPSIVHIPCKLKQTRHDSNIQSSIKRRNFDVYSTFIHIEIHNIIQLVSSGRTENNRDVNTIVAVNQMYKVESDLCWRDLTQYTQIPQVDLKVFTRWIEIDPTAEIINIICNRQFWWRTGCWFESRLKRVLRICRCRRFLFLTGCNEPALEKHDAMYGHVRQQLSTKERK